MGPDAGAGEPAGVVGRDGADAVAVGGRGRVPRADGGEGPSLDEGDRVGAGDVVVRGWVGVCVSEGDGQGGRVGDRADEEGRRRDAPRAAARVSPAGPPPTMTRSWSSSERSKPRGSSGGGGCVVVVVVVVVDDGEVERENHPRDLVRAWVGVRVRAVRVNAPAAVDESSMPRGSGGWQAVQEMWGNARGVKRGGKGGGSTSFSPLLPPSTAVSWSVLHSFTRISPPIARSHTPVPTPFPLAVPQPPPARYLPLRAAL